MRSLFAVLVSSAAVLAAAGQAPEKGAPQPWETEPVQVREIGVPLEPPAGFTPAPPEQTRWFRNAGFGLFIHWGLYSEAGGVWDGRRFYGIAEWLQARARLSGAEYGTLARRFNPTGYDAEEWVRVAKDAGVRYIVFTAKHHDGFAMWDSKVNDWDIVDRTPFARDPVKELVSAAQAAGIKVGFYYSQFVDWSEPNASGNNWEFDRDRRRDFDEYLDRKVLPQLRELLTRYGEIDLLWFDTPNAIPREASERLYRYVREFQPGILVNTRVGNNYGDYQTFADSEIPPAGVSRLPWEAIFTHNDSWGYSSFDRNFKSPGEIIRRLALVASRGGNLMLNIGPDGSGRLPAESVHGFGQIGAWLRTNGVAVYDAEPSPIGAMPWGVATRRPGTLYLHVFRRPSDGRLVVPGVFDGAAPRFRSAKFLANGAALGFARDGRDLVVAVPQALPDRRNSVIELRFDGGLPAAQERPTYLSNAFEEIPLEAAEAQQVGQGMSLKKLSWIRYFGEFSHAYTVFGLDQPDERLEWRVRVATPGYYHLTLQYAADSARAGREGLVDFAGESLAFRSLDTGPMLKNKPMQFIRHPVGVVRVDKPGIYTVRVRPREGQEEGEMFLLERVIVSPSE